MHNTISGVIHDKLYRNFYIETDHTWAIGDVHGCDAQFRTLCQRIKTLTPDATIYQLGDLIDRGPGLVEVVDVVDEYDVKSTIGNHELNFLMELHGHKECRSKARRATHDQFNRLVGSDQQRVVDCLQSMANMISVQTARGTVWTLSHSPIKDHDVLSEGKGAASYCMNNTPYTNSPMNANCVHGHQHWNYRHISEQIEEVDQHWYNIDGGCCYGGHLVGLNLDSLTHIWVKGVDWES